MASGSNVKGLRSGKKIYCSIKGELKEFIVEWTIDSLCFLVDTNFPNPCIKSPTFTSDDGKDTLSLTIYLNANFYHAKGFSIQINSNATKAVYTITLKNNYGFYITNTYLYRSGSIVFSELIAQEDRTRIEQYPLTVILNVKYQINIVTKVSHCLAYSSLETKLINKGSSSSDLNEVTLSVGDKDFKVRKATLVLNSPVFEAMLNSEMKEKSSNLVKITDIRPPVMEKMILYMNCLEVGDIKELVKDLLHAAEKYELEGLKLICAEELESQLTVENSLETFMLAKKYNIPQLADNVLQFMNVNSMAVLTQLLERISKF